MMPEELQGSAIKFRTEKDHPLTSLLLPEVLYPPNRKVFKQLDMTVLLSSIPDQVGVTLAFKMVDAYEEMPPNGNMYFESLWKPTYLVGPDKYAYIINRLENSHG